MATTNATRWMPSVIVVASGVFAGASFASDGGALDLTLGIAIIVVMAGWAWWISPLRHGDHVAHARTAEAAEPDDVIVYWRPGCPHCMRLRHGLSDRSDEVHWVNVWADDDAAAFVRSINDGNEQVPTVVTGAGERLDPTPTAVATHLG